MKLLLLMEGTGLNTALLLGAYSPETSTSAEAYNKNAVSDYFPVKSVTHQPTRIHRAPAHHDEHRVSRANAM